MREEFDRLNAEALALQKDNNRRIEAIKAGALGRPVQIDPAMLLSVQVNAFIDWSFEGSGSGAEDAAEAKVDFIMFLQRRYSTWLDETEANIRRLILTQGINGSNN